MNDDTTVNCLYYLLQIPCSNAIQAVNFFLRHQKIVQHLSGKTPAML
jgi:hypothetical protein